MTKAKRIFLDQSVLYPAAPALSPLTDGDLAKLARALEIDPSFRKHFDADPVAAAEAAEMHDLAAALELELRELVALAERFANDLAFRNDVDADPATALTAAGLPEATVEPLLHALDVPDDVLARLPEVVAHHHQQPPLRARLLTALLESTAVVERIRASARGARGESSR